MPLLKHQEIVEDRWQSVADEAVLPVEQAIIVSHTRLFSDDADYLFHCGCCLGVKLTSDDDVEALAPWINRLGIIVLEFPKFSDGRAYSSARILRSRMGFAGELRAVGDVLIDQFAFMMQCGFDCLEVPFHADIEAWCLAATEISVGYQQDVGHGHLVNALHARRQHAVIQSSA